MQCMKCGRDIEADQVFCDTCREDMEKYPVKPGTVVLLPHYTQYNLPKRAPKRTVSLEEQLRKLKKRSRIYVLLMVLFLALSVTLGSVAWTLYAEYSDRFELGQNYSAVGSHDETTAPSASAPAETYWD